MLHNITIHNITYDTVHIARNLLCSKVHLCASNNINIYSRNGSFGIDLIWDTKCNRKLHGLHHGTDSIIIIKSYLIFLSVSVKLPRS